MCAARTLKEGDHPLEGSLERTVADIKAAGHESTAVPVNISEVEECQQLVQAARSLYGPVDVLVNNAALTYFVPIKDYTVNRWMRSWAVNLHRAVRVEPPRVGGHAATEEWAHRQHLVGCGHRPRARPVRPENTGRSTG